MGGPGAPSAWLGNLITNKADGSGLQYSRNRYYDPRTGRFTQIDPIGLAGGLNLYGFAAGDPATFTDPFGLCPVPPRPECFFGGLGIANVRSPGPHGFAGYRSTAGAGWNGAMERIQRATVAGATVSLPHFDVGVESRNGRIAGPSTSVTTGTWGASANAGVVLSQPRPGDVNGSITLAAGVGGQVDFAVNGTSVRITGVRLVVGNPQGRASLDATVDVTPVPVAQRPWVPLEMPSDATNVNRRLP